MLVESHIMIQMFKPLCSSFQPVSLINWVTVIKISLIILTGRIYMYTLLCSRLKCCAVKCHCLHVHGN